MKIVNSATVPSQLLFKNSKFLLRTMEHFKNSGGGENIDAKEDR